MWIRNDSEIIQSDGIGLFTKEIVGDSLENREVPEDTIDNGIKHKCSEITRVNNNLCTNDWVGSNSWSLNEHTALCHFRCCLEMKVM